MEHEQFEVSITWGEGGGENACLCCSIIIISNGNRQEGSSSDPPPPIPNIPWIRLTIMYIFTSLNKFGWIYSYYTHTRLCWPEICIVQRLFPLYQCCGSASRWCGSGRGFGFDFSPWCGSGCGSGFWFFIWCGSADADPDPQHCSIHQQKPVDDV